jgi:hypothetical protein
VLGGERVERQDIVFGVGEQRCDLRQPLLELGDRVDQAPARLVAIGGGEELADDRAQRVVLVLAAVAAEVSEEVYVGRPATSQSRR